MIRAVDSAPLVIDHAPLVVECPDVSDEERAANVAALAEHKKNVAWWNAHADEIIAQHAGKYGCVLGQELFTGDDPLEVAARAEAAHPTLRRGILPARLLRNPVPRVYALRRTLGTLQRNHLATDDYRRS